MTLRNYILTYFGNKFKRTFAPMYYFCIKKSPTSSVGLLKKYIMELLKELTFVFSFLATFIIAYFTFNFYHALTYCINIV